MMRSTAISLLAIALIGATAPSAPLSLPLITFEKPPQWIWSALSRKG